MKCFVCGANAAKIATTIDTVSIVCPVCGEYDVSSSAIATGRWKNLNRSNAAMPWSRRSARRSLALAP
jgi:hypothetical protein